MSQKKYVTVYSILTTVQRFNELANRSESHNILVSFVMSTIEAVGFFDTQFFDRSIGDRGLHLCGLEGHAIQSESPPCLRRRA
jgi:hypothetical protein